MFKHKNKMNTLKAFLEIPVDTFYSIVRKSHRQIIALANNLYLFFGFLDFFNIFSTLSSTESAHVICFSNLCCCFLVWCVLIFLVIVIPSFDVTSYSADACCLCFDIREKLSNKTPLKICYVK